jgi:hypothetical protein
MLNQLLNYCVSNKKQYMARGENGQGAIEHYQWHSAKSAEKMILNGNK